ncbi:Katanin p80 WD40 repeat-containing subunit B1 [Dermatophagoides pteronyssinus]|uniref:Katanin p80 WD40 repeat-containing subunit B1 n=1 Tax=Dermatophagoides pteronyssinus TaxID=6956 RepID=A0ABQ8JKC0_DERPT|nr:Katanin p80 WD40 repeat-containing subunit B1 [Dermatophagoides pteronyssinus]
MAASLSSCTLTNTTITKPKWTSSIFGSYSSTTTANSCSSSSKRIGFFLLLFFVECYKYKSNFRRYLVYCVDRLPEQLHKSHLCRHPYVNCDLPSAHHAFIFIWSSRFSIDRIQIAAKQSMDTIRFDETIEEQAMNIHAFIYLSSSLFLSDFSSSSDCDEFVAHGSAVTCLALGQKSGRVMVTGGDDAKINLWAIGKPNCIMSLNGHRTSIECVKFNQNEDIVGAGSASVIQTLTGHKTNVRCLDFHPYGHFLASGSFDTSIKLWDYRKKTCIITYKVHTKDVHCLKLSPDGRWLASGGNEGSVMLYDIVAGKMLAELKGHSSSVTDVVFHPNEFLLASSSSDGTVKFWDLESFLQVSTTTYQSDIGAIRKIAFHPEGKALIASGKDAMKVFGWEPTHLYDVAQTKWGRLNDMTIMDEQIIAGTFSTTNVSVYMVDLNTIQPFNYNNTKSNICTRDNVLRQSTRRNFNFEHTSKTCKQLESLESSRTDDMDTMNGSDGGDSLAEIYNTCDYKEIFQSRRELMRTPPPLDDSTPNDQNLRSLQFEPTSLSSSTTGFAVGQKPSLKSGLMMAKGPTTISTPLHSVRHLSESLNNLNLNHRNNNIFPSTPLSPIIANNSNDNSTTVIKDSNIANNNHILPHSTSLTALNQLKHVNGDGHHVTTFPNITNISHNKLINTPSLISTSNPLYSSLYANASNSNTTLSPLNHHSLSVGPLSPSVHHGNSATSSSTATPTTTINKLSSTKLNEKSKSNNNNTSTLATTLTPNKITSMVRPIINDSNRPSITSSYSSYQQKSSNSANNDDHIITGVKSLSSMNHSNTNDSTMIIPEIRDHPAGLDFNDFLPKHIQQYGCDSQPFISEIETINTIMKGHKAAKAGLDYRRKQVQIVLAMWATKDSKTALEYAINLDEKSIIIDILNVMIWKPSVWNLDIALILLPCIQELLQSKYESYMSVGCSALALILKTFSPTIKNNISAPPGIGVDISREERYNKCMKCYNYLLSARAFVLKRQTLQGKIGRSFRELSILMQNLE